MGDLKARAAEAEQERWRMMTPQETANLLAEELAKAEAERDRLRVIVDLACAAHEAKAAAVANMSIAMSRPDRAMAWREIQARDEAVAAEVARRAQV